MSNGVNAPYGLSPFQYLGGAPWDGKVRTYLIAPGLPISIFSGDPVTISSTGTGKISGTIYPYNPATSTTIAPVGVFVGCKYVVPGQTVANSTTSFSYWPSGQTLAPGTVALAMVVDDPFVVYKIQTDAAAGVLQTSLGLNFNITYTPGSGNAQSGSSVAALASGTSAATSTLPLKIVGTPVSDMRGAPTYSTASAPIPYNDVLCLINSHYYKLGTTATLG